MFLLYSEMQYRDSSSSDSIALVVQVALLEKKSEKTPISEIATMGVNLVMGQTSDTVRECMAKMTESDIRHLPIVDDESGQVLFYVTFQYFE